MIHRRVQQRSDACLDQHQIGPGAIVPGQLSRYLLEQRRIPLGDQPRDLQIAGIADVRHHLPAVDPAGFLRPGHRLVIAPLHQLNPGALGADLLDPGGRRVRRNENYRLAAEPAGGPGHRAAMVAGGGGSDRHRAGPVLAKPLDSPGGTQCLEGLETEPLRFILDHEPADPQRGGQSGQGEQGSHRITREPAMEIQYRPVRWRRRHALGEPGVEQKVHHLRSAVRPAR